MDRILITRALVILFSILFMADLTQAQVSKPVNGRWSKKQLREVTVLLNEPGIGSGTGTIIGYEKRYFILTAQHVSSQLTNKSVVCFQEREKNKPIEFKLNDLVKGGKWYVHQFADISFIEIFPINDFLSNRLPEWHFPQQQIVLNNSLPTFDQDIVFFGFPVVDEKMAFLFPNVFQSRLSTEIVNSRRYDTNKECQLFYLDRPSVQGCSGSAVFTNVGPEPEIGGMFIETPTALFGIIHGTKNDVSGGKMATVTPTSYLVGL